MVTLKRRSSQTEQYCFLYNIPYRLLYVALHTKRRSNDRAIAAHNGMGAMPSVGKTDQVFKCGALSRKQR